jgi:TonB family protein
VFARAGVSHDVVTTAELARAAQVSLAEVDALVRAGELTLIEGRFIAWEEAVGAGRRLRSAGLAILPVVAAEAPELFTRARESHRAAALPAAVSGAVHVLALLLAVVLTTAGLGTAAARIDDDPEPLRLVFLAIPGPGGGGGGGGSRQPIPPPKAQKKGERRQSSPVPQIEIPEPIEPPKQPVKPPDPEPKEEPPVVAPVATVAADQTDRRGVLEEEPAETDSHGSGTNGGVGSGEGVGIGEGSGPGIGPGSGGGTGGGPYRPGSGIEPPRLLREVRADYTEEARRRGIQGEVLLEVVVRRDGSVGDARVIQGLGYGLERRAVDAVSQWRFAPARRLGSPVDVIVEVAVEFRLR